MGRHRMAAIGCLALAAWSSPAPADDAEALMKRSGCFRCHAVGQEKVGPAFRDVAAKCRGSPNAEVHRVAQWILSR